MQETQEAAAEAEAERGRRLRLIEKGASLSRSFSSDWNGADYLSDVLFPKRIVQKRGTATIMDLTVTKTNTYNPYVVMPVPANVTATGQ